MAPMSVMVMPRVGSPSITGAQYVSEPRVKYCGKYGVTFLGEDRHEVGLEGGLRGVTHP